jgi:hypothetical protein
MRDSASDNPTLSVSIASGVEAETFVPVEESVLSETSIATRSRYTIAKVSQGLNVKVAQSGASSQTEVFAVEAEVRPLTTVAGGQ